ncbi:hypothetical protein Csa_002227 [Cucumis sativus]|uniref:Uncharacterized protein n=1 Tax=Cucumis sativus TaxID=3659 RepID=A0A0A0LGW5_CUCSA|nr:hypothetical protein Csa_002227 [Cucumis sativus]
MLMTSESPRSQEIWMASNADFWKFNLDASWNDVEEITFILAGCARVEVKWPKEVLEALARIRGLSVHSDYFGHEYVLIWLWNLIVAHHPSRIAVWGLEEFFFSRHNDMVRILCNI